MIRFGVRSARIGRHRIKEPIPCPSCKQTGLLNGITKGVYFHIMWIPFFGIGKERVISCHNCGAIYQEEHFPRKSRTEIHASIRKANHGRGLWRFSGLFLLGFVALCIGIFFAYVLIEESMQRERYRKSREQQQEVLAPKIHKEQWRNLLEKDLFVSVYFPKKEEDSISFLMNTCTSESSLINPETTAYLSRVEGENVLIVMEVEELNGMSEAMKEKLYQAVNQCMDEVLEGISYNRYLAIGRGGKLYLQQSPKGVAKNSLAEESDLLRAFYSNLLRD